MLENIRRDFPVLRHHKKLIYLDTAASALTPRPVIAAVRDYYEHCSANVARGIYDLSEAATASYENARTEVATFLGTRADNIVFTSGTTMSLNIVAHGLAHTLTRRANIVVTAMDHHANFVPWQQLAHTIGCDFRIVNITKDGEIDMNDMRAKIDRHTAIFAFPFVSNVLGTITPAANIIQTVKTINPSLLTVVDAAQAAPHITLDVERLGCDFLAFSGHKLYGPTGIGVLYGTSSALATLSPLFTGGEMVHTVTQTASTFKAPPHCFEAGTPPIAQAIGLGRAVRYLKEIGMENIEAHDRTLTTYALTRLHTTFDNDILTVYGPQAPQSRSGLISLTLAHIHPHDIADILNSTHNIAVRAGAHCAQPLHTCLNTHATVRMSFGVYTTRADIDAFIDGLKDVLKIFHRNKYSTSHS